MFSSRKSAAPSTGYLLTKSLRFRSSASAYLNRTPASASNRKTWTWSAWVKRSNPSANGTLFAARTGSGATYFVISFQSAGDFRIESNSETAYPLYKTNALFRDPSAWYHIVVALDMTQATSTNRLKVWVNNVLQTTASYNVPAQNTDLAVNSTETHLMGQQASGNYFDGYMTEINFIDGQALTPSSFGETSAATGVWQPIRYTGTYGTNGFYLDFEDTSSVAALGYDAAGSNDWTVNNISLTSGSTYDSMKDVPTLTDTDTANYCTLNPISPLASGSITNANLTFTSGTSDAICIGTFGVSSGKWYWEITATNVNASLSAIGIIGQPPASLTVDLRTPSNGYCYISNGNKGNNNTTSAYGATYASGDVIGVALDMDAGTLVFYKNNSSQGTAYSSLTGTFTPAMSDLSGASSGAVFDCNFGQRPFSYTPPTGFKALNTFNLPTPTIGATASSQAANYFASTLYTGTGSNITITNTVNGISFQPDFVWTKSRSAATNNILINAVTGGANYLVSDSTSGESNAPSDAIQSFNSTGYVMGTGGAVNTNGATYVAWQWKANGSGSTNTSGSITSTVSANTTAGFSIVTYTGTGANATVGHGLGVKPTMIIVKERSASQNWAVYYLTPSGLGGADRYLSLNTTAAYTLDSTVFQSVDPTSSVFSIGTSSLTNASSQTYVAYCFASVSGYSQISGGYTGNGSSDGPFIYTGFRPRFLMIKRTSGTPANWYMWDSSRSPFNAAVAELYPNLSNAEANGSNDFDFLSNGFKTRNTTDAGINGSGETFIYMAFAENPFKFANAR